MGSALLRVLTGVDGFPLPFSTSVPRDISFEMEVLGGSYIQSRSSLRDLFPSNSISNHLLKNVRIVRQDISEGGVIRPRTDGARLIYLIR